MSINDVTCRRRSDFTLSLYLKATLLVMVVEVVNAMLTV